MTPHARIQAHADQLDAHWRDDARWQGIERTYTAIDVIRLRGSVRRAPRLAILARRACPGEAEPRASRLQRRTQCRSSPRPGPTDTRTDTRRT